MTLIKSQYTETSLITQEASLHAPHSILLPSRGNHWEQCGVYASDPFLSAFPSVFPPHTDAHTNNINVNLTSMK